MNSDVGWFYYFAGNYDQAIEECIRTLELEPGFLLAHTCLVEAYDRNGMHEEAYAEAQEALAAAGATDDELATIRSLELIEGRGRTLRWWLIHGDDLGPYKLALIHLRLASKSRPSTSWRRASPTGTFGCLFSGRTRGSIPSDRNHVSKPFIAD